jgi:hypothetical protein
MCTDLPSNLESYAEYQLIPKRIVEETMFKIPENMDTNKRLSLNLFPVQYMALHWFL